MPRAVMRVRLIVCFDILIRLKSQKVILALVLALAINSVSAQTDSLAVKNRKRSRLTSLGMASVLNAGSYKILSNVWYKEHSRQSFHLFNDFGEWNGLDKLGHVTAAYVLSENSELFFRKFHWNEKSPLVAALFGFTYTSTLEVLDAYSEGWGFSMPDLGANFLGSSLYFVQNRCFSRQFVRFKWSFQKTNLASLNPSLLGTNKGEQILKDYNGQTYWATINLFKERTDRNRPKWLALSIGYGINNFTRARPSQVIGLQPYSQYYISLDIDWSQVPIRNKHVKNIVSALNFIKLPFPTLQLDNKNGLTLHALYF